MGLRMSRTWRGLAVVVGLGVVVAGLLVRPDAGAQATSPCEVSPDKVAAPSEIPLGATVRVTLTLSAACPAEEAPVDAVLVLDVSASMGNDRKLENARAAATAFVDEMDLSQSRVGLVLFNQDAGVRVPLTSDPRPVLSALGGLIAGGRTNISSAIDVARQELLRDPQGNVLAMVVLTDGFNTVPGAEPVPVAAAAAKAAGITVATFCAGGQCDPDLEQAASDPALYYNVTEMDRLAELYRQLADHLQANAIATLTIRDEIPGNMRYIPGSAVPVPDEVGPNYLVWRLKGLPGPAGLAYDLEPLEPGLHPTNVVATGDFTDRMGLPGSTVFPIPQVRVLPPPCPPQPMELYFLIDDSNCLLNAFLNEMPAREAIVIGIGRVMDGLSMGRDRAAVIGFGDTAQTYQELTDDRQAILDAARAIAMLDNSARLDLAYAETARQIARTHQPGSLIVTLTITDGPMNSPLQLTELRARALRDQGVRHYTIGVGDLAQYATLRAVSEPGGLREVDFGGDVISAYLELGAMAVEAAQTCLPTTPTPPIVGPGTPAPDATATAGPRGAALHLPHVLR